jgi:hypothetical protein
MEKVVTLWHCSYSLITSPYVVNGHRDQPLPGVDQPSSSGSNFRTGSELFFMYSKILKVEVYEIAGRWKKDADVTLIFVSCFVVIRANTS